MELQSLGFADVDGVWALWTFTDFELDGISVVNFTGHLGLVNEEILSVFLFDETKAFCLVEPLYCTCWHSSSSGLM